MNSAIETMLSHYSLTNNIERENAIKEIIQEIALAGLSHSDFFQNAAFYGGTSLRIFYGLNRFSEDLDFALLKKELSFDLSRYFPYLEKEFEAYGIKINVEHKKSEKDSKVKSAFLKGNTLILMLSFFPKSEEAKHFISNQTIKIKFEIYTDNPSGGNTEIKYRMLPSPYEIRVFDEPTLFAGKIHAIICRNYMLHVKGRDYFDYLFYMSRGIKFNLTYLQNKLKNTGGIIGQNEKLTLEKVKKLLKEKFESVDYKSAKEDVSNFISNKKSIEFWKKELFIETLKDLKNE